MQELIIGQNDAGKRLDRFLARTCPLLPPSMLNKYIRLKRVKINAKRTTGDYKLVVGDACQLYINDEYLQRPNADTAYKTLVPELDIIYEDENILLVNKKAGQIVHSDDKEEVNTTVSHIQAYLYANGQWKPEQESAFAPALCNRIDKNTSGIVIAAKNAAALREINRAIKDRQLEKRYLCLINGKIAPKEGRLTGYLFKDSKKNMVFVRDESEKGTKTAITQYKTLWSDNNVSLLECNLITGRTHQIRAQLAHAGHPLLGDGKYGVLKESALTRPGTQNIDWLGMQVDFRKNRKFQALCSYKLVFKFADPQNPLAYLNGREFKVERVLL